MRSRRSCLDSVHRLIAHGSTRKGKRKQSQCFPLETKLFQAAITGVLIPAHIDGPPPNALRACIIMCTVAGACDLQNSCVALAEVSDRISDTFLTPSTSG